MVRLNKKALDGKIETLLLAVLAEGPSYGYQMVRDLNERSAGLLRMGEGTVYPVLHRLEERELIAATWEKGTAGRPRKYYRLTPKGRRRPADNREQWQALVQLMTNVLGPAVAPADGTRRWLLQGELA